MLRKKHKPKKRSRGKRRRVDLTAGPNPASSAVPPPPTPSPTLTIPRHSDAGQLCQASLVSSDGEYFDCLSDMSDPNMEKPPSLHRSSSKLSMARRSPSPTGNPHEEEAEPGPEAESGPSTFGFPTSLWDILPWRLRPNTADDDTAGPSEEQSEATGWMLNDSSVSSSTLEQEQNQPKALSACLSAMRSSARQPPAKQEMRTKKRYPVKVEAGSTLQAVGHDTR